MPIWLLRKARSRVDLALLPSVENRRVKTNTKRRVRANTDVAMPAMVADLSKRHAGGKQQAAKTEDKQMRFHERRSESPNDPKLRDGGAGHDLCVGEGGKGKAEESTGHDPRSRSLQRMVRRRSDSDDFIRGLFVFRGDDLSRVTFQEIFPGYTGEVVNSKKLAREINKGIAEQLRARKRHVKEETHPEVE